jgi:hypothetical protein
VQCSPFTFWNVLIIDAGVSACGVSQPPAYANKTGSPAITIATTVNRMMRLALVTACTASRLAIAGGGMSYCVGMMTSTRRFLARPSGSSEPSGRVFGATGFALPNPLVCSATVEMPP